MSAEQNSEGSSAADESTAHTLSQQSTLTSTTSSDPIIHLSAVETNDCDTAPETSVSKTDARNDAHSEPAPAPTPQQQPVMSPTDPETTPAPQQPSVTPFVDLETPLTLIHQQLENMPATTTITDAGAGAGAGDGSLLSKSKTVMQIIKSASRDWTFGEMLVGLRYYLRAQSNRSRHAEFSEFIREAERFQSNAANVILAAEWSAVVPPIDTDDNDDDISTPPITAQPVACEPTAAATAAEPTTPEPLPPLVPEPPPPPVPEASVAAATLAEVQLWKRFARIVRYMFKVPLPEIVQKTGVYFIGYDLKPAPLRPAWVVCVDDKTRTVLLIFRGTQGVADIVTDLHATAEPFIGPLDDDDDDDDTAAADSDSDDVQSDVDSVVESTAAVTEPTKPSQTEVSVDAESETYGKPIKTRKRPKYYCHKGIMSAAKWFDQSFVKQIVKRTLAAHPGYSLRLLGHSLGGGTAAILTLLWRHEFAYARIRCFAYAAPPCMSLRLARASFTTKLITTFINGDDIVTRLSTHSIEELRKRVAGYPWREDLRRDLSATRIAQFYSSVSSKISAAWSYFRGSGSSTNNAAATATVAAATEIGDAELEAVVKAAEAEATRRPIESYSDSDCDSVADSALAIGTDNDIDEPVIASTSEPSVRECERSASQQSLINEIISAAAASPIINDPQSPTSPSEPNQLETVTPTPSTDQPEESSVTEYVSATQSVIVLSSSPQKPSAMTSAAREQQTSDISAAATATSAASNESASSSSMFRSRSLTALRNYFSATLAKKQPQPQSAISDDSGPSPAAERPVAASTSTAPLASDTTDNKTPAPAMPESRVSRLWSMIRRTSSTSALQSQQHIGESREPLPESLSVQQPAEQPLSQSQPIKTASPEKPVTSSSAATAAEAEAEAAAEAAAAAAVRLYPPGRIYQLLTVDGAVYLRPTDNARFTAMVVSQSWLEDHKMRNYFAVLNRFHLALSLSPSANETAPVTPAVVGVSSQVSPTAVAVSEKGSFALAT